MQRFSKNYEGSANIWTFRSTSKLMPVVQKFFLKEGLREFKKGWETLSYSVTHARKGVEPLLYGKANLTGMSQEKYLAVCSFRWRLSSRSLWHSRRTRTSSVSRSARLRNPDESSRCNVAIWKQVHFFGNSSRKLVHLTCTVKPDLMNTCL